MTNAYAEFLARKGASAPSVGVPDDPPPAPYLFPFQQDLATWALRRGKACVFASVGLGKTRVAGEFAAQASAYLDSIGERSDVLILAPLSVGRVQTVPELERLGMAAKYCKGPEDITPGAFSVTNYDRLDRFDPKRFGVVVLDESSVIKHADSKTRGRIIGSFRDTPFKLACTATPAPNDRLELGNHAEFVNAMTMQEMLSEFFVHDSGKTQSWRLKGHAQERFWQWVASWGAVVGKPSDLGYDNSGYDLPPLIEIDHCVRATMSQHNAIRAERCGPCNGEGKTKRSDEDIESGLDDYQDCENCQGTGKIVMGQLSLFPEPARSLKVQRRARRETLADRVKSAVDVVSAEPWEQWLVWCELNDEADELIRAIAKEIPGSVEVRGAHSADKKEAAAVGFASGSIPVLVSKASIFGYGLNLQNCARTLFVGATHKFEEVHQALGRNHRFGQKREVHAHYVFSELEGNVRENLRRKATEFKAMQDAMRAHVAAYVRQNVRGSGRTVAPYDPSKSMTVPEWLKTEDAA